MERKTFLLMQVSRQTPRLRDRAVADVTVVVATVAVAVTAGTANKGFAYIMKGGPYEPPFLYYLERSTLSF